MDLVELKASSLPLLVIFFLLFLMDLVELKVFETGPKVIGLGGFLMDLVELKVSNATSFTISYLLVSNGPGGVESS